MTTVSNHQCKKALSPQSFMPYALIIIVALMAALLWTFFANPKVSSIKQHAREGFSIHGQYAHSKLGKDDFLQLAIDERGEWQISNSYQGKQDAEGFFSRTEDPNLYKLSLKDNTEYGMAHIAYDDGTGNDGYLFILKTDGSCMCFDKKANQPGFVVQN